MIRLFLSTKVGRNKYLWPNRPILDSDIGVDVRKFPADSLDELREESEHFLDQNLDRYILIHLGRFGH